MPEISLNGDGYFRRDDGALLVEAPGWKYGEGKYLSAQQRDGAWSLFVPGPRGHEWATLIDLDRAGKLTWWKA